MQQKIGTILKQAASLKLKARLAPASNVIKGPQKYSGERILVSRRFLQVQRVLDWCIKKKAAGLSCDF
jgi:hypothetical protein